MATRVRIDAGAQARLQELGDKFVVEKVLPKIVTSAKRIVPIDSGDLQDSIHAEVSSEGMYVVADEDYSAHVEQGTSKMAAQPYLRPALYSTRI